MMKYKSPRLDAKTPQADKTKLVNALRAVQGVESAVLHPATHEFEIKARDKQQPKPADISAAASKAGFAISEPAR